jgi:hypothetical protein
MEVCHLPRQEGAINAVALINSAKHARRKRNSHAGYACSAHTTHTLKQATYKRDGMKCAWGCFAVWCDCRQRSGSSAVHSFVQCKNHDVPSDTASLQPRCPSQAGRPQAPSVASPSATHRTSTHTRAHTQLSARRLPFPGAALRHLKTSTHAHTRTHRSFWLPPIPSRGLCESQLLLLLLAGQLHIRGQAQLLQQRDHAPGHVDLPPLQPVAGAELKGMVVIVPSLAERQETNPPVVAGEVACGGGVVCVCVCVCVWRGGVKLEPGQCRAGGADLCALLLCACRTASPSMTLPPHRCASPESTAHPLHLPAPPAPCAPVL